MGVALSGPITDSLGYRISYVHDEFTGPDEWIASDGVEMGTQETGTFSAKLNFEFSDNVYGEVMYTNLDQQDGAAARWTLNPANCSGNSGVYRNSMGARPEMFTDAWDCDITTEAIRRNHDVYGQFIDNYDPANHRGLSLDAYLAQTDPTGATYEQILRGHTVDPFAKTTRDRYQGELNFEIGDSLLTFLGMSNEEFYHRWNDTDYNDTIAVISMGMLGMNVGTMSDPTDIEETYLEARWVSPADERLRYTLSASHYEYDFLTNVYFNYGALAYGLVYEGGGMAGQPVNPARNLIIANSTSNQGLAFGLQYDLSDRTTLSLEGRYQTDENCGADEVNSLEACTTTESFAPRTSINYELSEDSSMYVQVSQGTNPAGINIAYSNPGFVQALQIANGSIPVPAVAPDGVSVPSNAGTIYNGSDGIHFPTVSYSASTYESYDEEVLTNFEVGYKSSFLDGRGNFTAALYLMDWENLVSAGNLGWNDDSSVAAGDPYDGWDIDGYWDAFDGTRTFWNTGDAEFYGLEMDASFAVSDIWTLGGNLSLTNSEYTDYCSVNGPSYTLSNRPPFRPFAFDILTPEDDGVEANCALVNGNTIPRTSEVKGAFHVTAFLPNDIAGMRTSLRADLRHTGDSFQDDFNQIKVGNVTTMNLSASMRNDNLTLRLFLNNITDEDYPLNIGTSNYYTQNPNPAIPPAQAGSWNIVPRRPREAGLQVGYEF